MLTSVEFGVFTKLANRRLTGAELGAEFKLHPRAIADFFDALVAMKFLDRDGDGPAAKLHDWNLEKKLHLLRAAYDALPPGAALVAIEALIDDPRRENVQGLLMSLNMLIPDFKTKLRVKRQGTTRLRLASGRRRHKLQPWSHSKSDVLSNAWRMIAPVSKSTDGDRL